MRPEATAAEELSGRDRREVRSAVRHGRAVDDPALAPAAIELACDVQVQARSWTRQTPEGWPSLLRAYGRNEAWMMVLPMLLIAIWITDPFTIALEVLFVFMLGRLLVRYARHAPLQAAQSEAANRALLGESPSLITDVPTPLPWWKSRAFVPRGKPEAVSWLPIPLNELIPVWIAYAAVVVISGLTLPRAAQFVLAMVLFFLYTEIERRLAERVEAKLGPEQARRARGCDISHSARRKWTALFVLLLLAQVFWVGAIFSSGVFRDDGIAVIFGLGLLVFFIERDLASRWRWRRLQPHVD